MAPAAVWIAVVAVLIGTLLLRNKVNDRKQPKLPGPPGLPFVGNMFQLPKKRPWVKLAEWSREYGPIYQVQLGRRKIIVLGTAESAMELLDKRSAIYSSRPRQIMTSELVSRGLRLTFMQYGDLWRRERKLLHQLTAPKPSSTYEPIQDWESTTLLRDLCKRPEAFWGHAQRYAGSTIMQIAFNTRAPTPEDAAITDMRKINEAMTKTAVPGSYIVDTLPFLNYLPRFLAPWKVEADLIFDDTLRLFSKHVNKVRNDLAEGKDTNCFAKSILQSQKEYQLTDNQSVFMAGAMYGAGSDTTADAISTCIFTLTSQPHVLPKAHEELDRVIGRDRLPEFADQDDLPYCNAIIREIMRWRSVIAGGLSHASTEDDVYNGYFIPKGSTVLANHWSIHMDPDVYPNPEAFDPDRFMKNGKLVGTKYSNTGHHAFGFGRRICPGSHIADRSLFIVFTRIMWAFNIKNKVDSKGNPIMLDVDAFSEGFSSHPHTFQTDIKPRFPEVVKIIDTQLSQFE